jgi:hypothetical protein
MITGQGYFRLCELADGMTLAELKVACPGILPGFAKAILSYATADVKWVREKAEKEHKRRTKKDHS